MGGGVAAGALVLLLAAGALYFYRGSTAAKKPAGIDEPADAELGDVKATLVDARLTEETPDGVAAWLRRQDLPGDVEGLCSAVVDKRVSGPTCRGRTPPRGWRRDAGLRKAVVGPSPRPTGGRVRAPHLRRPPRPPPDVAPPAHRCCTTGGFGHLSRPEDVDEVGFTRASTAAVRRGCAFWPRGGPSRGRQDLSSRCAGVAGRTLWGGMFS